MKNTDLEFNIQNEVLSLGLKGAYFLLYDVDNKKSYTKFNEIKSNILEEVKSQLSYENIHDDEILKGFRQLHESVGISEDKYISSPENLLKFLHDNGHLPHINLIVDIYNSISIESRLAIGAHDLEDISGSVSLQITSGSESYVPLGSTNKKSIEEGLYSYVDDDNDIICLLESRQVEKTKITDNTSNCFYIVQGNPSVKDEYLKLFTEKLISMTKTYCGGQEKMLHAPWLQ